MKPVLIKTFFFWFSTSDSTVAKKPKTDLAQTSTSNGSTRQPQQHTSYQNTSQPSQDTSNQYNAYSAAWANYNQQVNHYLCFGKSSLQS